MLFYIYFTLAKYILHDRKLCRRNSFLNQNRDRTQSLEREKDIAAAFNCIHAIKQWTNMYSFLISKYVKRKYKKKTKEDYHWSPSCQ